MKTATLKQRLIAQFGAGMYRHIFKEEVDNICANIMGRRLILKKHDRFYLKRFSLETNEVISKFREKTYYEALYLRVYKEHGERVLRAYADTTAYLEALNERREETYRSMGL